MTPDEAVHGGADPVSKPGLPSFWPEHPPPPELIVQPNVAEPETWLTSFAVAVTVYEPVVVGAPVILPVVDPMVRPGGRPVADQVYGGVPPVALSWRLTA